MKKLLSGKSLIIVMLILALVLRLIALNQSLWLDEAIGALVVKERGFWDIAVNFPKGDNHPPLYYMTLDIWSNLFGYSEVALRSLSVLFSLATIYISYLVVEELLLGGTSKKSKVNGNMSIVAATLLATSPFFIYYSQEARMYMMAAFFATTAVYSFLKVIGEKGDPLPWWMGFSLSIIALVFTDYVPVFLLPIFWIYSFVVKKPFSWWRRFIASFLPLGILGVLWIPTFLYQSGRGQWLLQTLPAWQKLAGGATVKQAGLVWIKFILGRISFYDKLLYYSLVVVVSIPFLYLLAKALKSTKKLLLMWLWLAFPLVFGFIVSFVFPAFIYFRFVYVYPAFAILVAYAIVNTKPEKLSSAMLASVLFINVTFTLVYYFHKTQQRENWRGAISYVENNCSPTQSCVALFTNTEAFAPARYYANGRVEMSGSTNSISADKAKTAEKTKELLDGKNKVFYFNYLQDLHDPQGFVQQTIENEGFVQMSEKTYNGVGKIYTYTRD